MCLTYCCFDDLPTFVRQMIGGAAVRSKMLQARFRQIQGRFNSPIRTLFQNMIKKNSKMSSRSSITGHNSPNDEFVTGDTTYGIEKQRRRGGRLHSWKTTLSFSCEMKKDGREGRRGGNIFPGSLAILGVLNEFEKA